MKEFIYRIEDDESDESEVFIGWIRKHGHELIRCKDCKFSMSGIDKHEERYILCQLHDRSCSVTDDGFCSWAEREEE